MSATINRMNRRLLLAREHLSPTLPAEIVRAIVKRLAELAERDRAGLLDQARGALFGYWQLDQPAVLAVRLTPRGTFVASSTKYSVTFVPAGFTPEQYEDNVGGGRAVYRRIAS